MTDLAFNFDLCKPSGEPIEELVRFQNRRITHTLNLPTVVSFDMDMYAPQYPFMLLEAGPRIKVYRTASDAELAIDNVTRRKLLAYATLPSEGSEEDANSRFATMTFKEPMWVLDDRYVDASVTYTQVDQGMILWQVQTLENAKPNGDTYVKQGSVLTGTLRDRTYDPGKNVSGLIDDMTKVDGGCDVAFVPVDYYALNGSNGMGTFNAYKQRGLDRPDVHFVYAAPREDGTSGGLDTNVGNMKRRRAKVFTKATFVGSGGIQQSYQNVASPYGLSEDYETVSDVSIPQTLLDKAVGVVANRQNAPMIIDVLSPTTEAPQPYHDYDLGDIVYCTCRSGGMEFYDLPMRVMGIDIAIDQNGKLDVTLTLATLAADVPTVTLPPDGSSPVPETPPSGGGSGDDNSSVTIPHTAVHGTCAISSSPEYNGNLTKYFQPNANPGWVYGYTVSGLTPGATYKITCQSRGPDVALTGDKWQLWAGDASNLSGATYGPDESGRVFSGTAATRKGWDEASVTFVADQEECYTGIYVEQDTFGSNYRTYYSQFSIEAV